MEGGGEEKKRRERDQLGWGHENNSNPNSKSPHKGSYNSCQFLYHPLLPGIPHVTTLTHGTGKELCVFRPPLHSQMHRLYTQLLLVTCPPLPMYYYLCKAKCVRRWTFHGAICSCYDRNKTCRHKGFFPHRSNEVV